MKKVFIIVPLLLWISVIGFAQEYPQSGSEIKKQIDKLGVLNRVLYLAAHPDDENTRLIAYLSKCQNVETAYLSLTRGDGGQNLIGDEKGALLGMIRTQELLEARKIDGGSQYFTRAIDFGYSKSADETFKHWEKDSVLADVVRVIRRFKPDVIITRFPPDSRAGHGHHTVSAILTKEAFSAAADKKRFPESAKVYGVWETKKLYWNESSWWNKTIDEHRDDYVTINIGAYDPLLGVPYSEIASHSRSQHQSQGFGMQIQRGEHWEYLKLLEGDSTIKGVLEGKIRTWSDMEGGNVISGEYWRIKNSFNPAHPEYSVDPLIRLYFLIQDMPENRFKVSKSAEVKNLIAACGGLHMAFTSTQPLLVQSQEFGFSAKAISQSGFPYQLSFVGVGGDKFGVETKLENKYTNIQDTILAPSNVSTPYWLAVENGNDMFWVSDRSQISNPENKSVITAHFHFKTRHGDLVFDRPLEYVWTDRVQGELHRDVNVVEPLSIEFDKKVSLARDNQLLVRVRANMDLKNVNVQLFWDVKDGGETKIMTIEKLIAGQSYPVRFDIQPPFNEVNIVTAKVWVEEDKKFINSLTEITYPHMQTQVVMPIAKMTLIKEEIKITRKTIGYIMGSGDEVPVALREMGCDVTVINPSQITLQDLKKYDGVVVGIRAYNKIEAMKSVSPLLNKYVFEGGFVMVQYNTNRGLITNDLGPYPFTLSRDRVTEEDSKVVRLQRDHPILKTPNVITDADFDNWVQERGLYFASEWDEHYTPILSWNDTGEKRKDGSVLVANYGEGHYVFTGISFFRQLPAGVFGAYKLFGNLLSYGKE